MLRKLLLVAAMVVVSCVWVDRVCAMAGDLDTPGISIPTKDDVSDPTALAMNAALVKHKKQFVQGHFINAHTVLEFAGGTKTINSLLRELSKIDGAVLHVRLVSGSGAVENLPRAGEQASPASDCLVTHNGWSDAHSISVTIYVGDRVKLEELQLPAIRGQAVKEVDAAAP